MYKSRQPLKSSPSWRKMGEDRIDVDEALKALKSKKFVSWSKAKKQLGL
jgi:hypothetical protein